MKNCFFLLFCTCIFVSCNNARSNNAANDNNEEMNQVENVVSHDDTMYIDTVCLLKSINRTQIVSILYIEDYKNKTVRINPTKGKREALNIPLETDFFVYDDESIIIDSSTVKTKIVFVLGLNLATHKNTLYAFTYIDEELTYACTICELKQLDEYYYITVVYSTITRDFYLEKDNELFHVNPNGSISLKENIIIERYFGSLLKDYEKSGKYKYNYLLHFSGFRDENKFNVEQMDVLDLSTSEHNQANEFLSDTTSLTFVIHSNSPLKIINKAGKDVSDQIDSNLKNKLSFLIEDYMGDDATASLGKFPLSHIWEIDHKKSKIYLLDSGSSFSHGSYRWLDIIENEDISTLKHITSVPEGVFSSDPFFLSINGELYFFIVYRWQYAHEESGSTRYSLINLETPFREWLYSWES